MKKFLALLLALTLVFALVACSNEKDTTSEPDTSTTQTETESTENTETTDSDTADESSSETETPSSSTSTPTTSTETSKPTTSNKDNTTSSKPSNTTSTPTTSTPSHTHSWSDWKTETKALIGKDGTEKRTCSSCKETETRSTKADAVYNSFYDYELHWFMLDIIGFSGGINSQNLIFYFSQKYEGRDAETFYPSSSTVFNWLSSRFVLTDSLKEEMKQDARYNKSSDTFALSFEGNCGNLDMIGYIHNGGNKYTVYYSFDNWGHEQANYKVELEYNLLNGKPNKYLLIERVNSIPNNIIK